jgi:hypothetical protein
MPRKKLPILKGGIRVNRFAFVLSLLTALASSAFCAGTIAVSVRWDAATAGDAAMSLATKLEDGVMDGFFDGGGIVSNDRIAASSAREFRDAEFNLQDARAGGAGTAVVVFLSYATSSVKSGFLYPAHLSYKVVDLDVNEVIVTRDMTGMNDLEDDILHADTRCVGLGKAIAADVLTLLDGRAIR